MKIQKVTVEEDGLGSYEVYVEAENDSEALVLFDPFQE